MSERKWRPGDLITGDDGSRFWIVEVTANTTAAATRGRAWVPGSSAVDADGNGWRADSVEGARPLVVIDPEDREQIERLGLALDRHSGFENRWNEVQSALREFANPKPPKCGATLVIGPRGAVYPCTKHEGHLEPHANEVYSWTGVTP
jgi:hypothetical protein